MIDALPATEQAVVETEAYQTLMARVSRRKSQIPADLLVRHVLRCVPPREWPARVEALDALLRRLEAVSRDGLRIDSRPEGKAMLGLYRTRTRKLPARPYQTVIWAIDPVEVRCDCPDFLKSSLGLCKHALTVLEHIHGKAGRLAQARKEQEFAPGAYSQLRWSPIRPMTGPGDWLDRVEWRVGTNGAAPRSERALRARRWFRLGEKGTLVLKQSFADHPANRLALVEDLIRLVPAPSQGRPASSDPALRALLTRERERLRQVIHQIISARELQAAIKCLKRPLYPYQRHGVERFLALGRLLLADDMGLGKTAQAIASTEILWRSHKIRRALLVTPASLKPQWAREWAQFSDLRITVIDGSPQERQAVYQANRSGIFIVNYEQVIRDLEIIRSWAPDLVVLDEAQRIKNWATKTALSVKGLTPAYRLVLTGTPMENRIEELASIVEWVDDMALEPKWRLSAAHAIRADGKREVVGVQNLETLRQRLQGCMVRRVRQEVLDQLPPRTDTRVPVTLTPDQLAAHDALIQPILVLMQKAQTRPLTQAEFLKLMSLLTTQRIISNGLAQLNFEEVWPALRGCAPEESVINGLCSPKLLELRQLVRQLVLDQERKVVIFSQWRRMLSLAHWAVSDLLAGRALRAGFFTGVEGQRRRTQNIVEFHDDPDFRILFATDAGGVGLNLQHASNCVINLELPWNPAVLEQRIGRVYRLGQKQPIDAYNLVSEQGIESRIAGLVSSKQAFFKGLFDGDSDSVRFDQASSFLSRVQKIYEPVSGASSTLLLPLGEVAAAADDSDLDIDEPDDDVFGPIVDAADESNDQAPALGPARNADSNVEGDGVRGAALSPATSPDVSTKAASAGEIGSGGGPLTEPASHAPALPSATHVRQLFTQLQVRPGANGRVVIEAPPEAASTLCALFEGMAALLQAAARPAEESS